MLNKIQGITNKFIWGYKKQRIKASVATTTKIQYGGVTHPNITYYHATMME